MGGVIAPSRGGWIGLVAVITSIQAALALMTRVLPLFGLPLTLAAGVPPESVGQLAAATSFGSMVFFLWGPSLLSGFSAMRQLQAGSVLTGLAVLLCLHESWSFMLLSAFLIGVGYGPSTPAGSDIMMRAAPPRRRAFAFSIKQAGVPLGGLVAGLILPSVAVWGGVEAALWLSALMAIGAAFLLGRWRGEMEGADGPGGLRRPLDFGALLGAPLRMARIMLASPQLRAVTIAGFGLGVAQGVLMGYFPVFLSDHVGWSLAAVGVAFALLQGMGVGGRVFMGWLSDRIAAPGRATLWLCFISAGTMALLATLGPESSALWVGAVSGLAGLTVISWNGVFLSDLASAAPEGRVGEITSAGTFVIFFGYVVSPLAIQGVFSATGGYAAGFLVTAAAPLIAAAALLARPGGGAATRGGRE